MGTRYWCWYWWSGWWARTRPGRIQRCRRPGRTNDSAHRMRRMCCVRWHQMLFTEIVKVNLKLAFWVLKWIFFDLNFTSIVANDVDVWHRPERPNWLISWNLLMTPFPKRCQSMINLVSNANRINYYSPTSFNSLSLLLVLLREFQLYFVFVVFLRRVSLCISLSSRVSKERTRAIAKMNKKNSIFMIVCDVVFSFIKLIESPNFCHMFI